MAFGGSGFAKQKFAGANAVTVTPHAYGTGFTRDFSREHLGRTSDRGCGTGFTGDRPQYGGHIADRRPT